MTYIAPRAKTLAHVDRLVDWRRGKKRAPVTVEWDLSNRCVLGCTYDTGMCHFAHTHTKGPWASRHRFLPMAFDNGGDLADMTVVARGLSEMARAGVKAVVWSGGGEPTTHPNWKDAVVFAQVAGLEQGMYTLGGLLTEEAAWFLSDHLTWVVVSLDCVDGETYAREKGVPASRFEAACDGIRWMSGGKATVGVSFLLHAKNWTRMSEMWALARNLGATYVTFRPSIHTSPDAPSVTTDDRRWITDAMPTLSRFARYVDVEIDVERFTAYRDWVGHGYSACEGPKLTTTVTPDGRVWVCPQRRGIVGSELGDLRRESFAEIVARHPGEWMVDQSCRVMCRLHTVNTQIAALSMPIVHEAFV